LQSLDRPYYPLHNRKLGALAALVRAYVDSRMQDD
jgi:hypothetical protein